MANIIANLKQGLDSLFPKTLTKCVYDEAGNRLDNKLSVGQAMPAGLPQGAINSASGYYVNGQPLIVDTGWISMPLASGLTEYETCRYRRVGNVVMITGSVRGITGNDFIISTLPTVIRPTYNHIYIQHCNCDMTARYRILPDGRFYMNYTDGGTITASNYFTLDTMYLAG